MENLSNNVNFSRSANLTFSEGVRQMSAPIRVSSNYFRFIDKNKGLIILFTIGAPIAFSLLALIGAEFMMKHMRRQKIKQQLPKLSRLCDGLRSRLGESYQPNNPLINKVAEGFVNELPNLPRSYATIEIYKEMLQLKELSKLERILIEKIVEKSEQSTSSQLQQTEEEQVSALVQSTCSIQ